MTSTSDEAVRLLNQNIVHIGNSIDFVIIFVLFITVCALFWWAYNKFL